MQEYEPLDFEEEEGGQTQEQEKQNTHKQDHQEQEKKNKIEEEQQFEHTAVVFQSLAQPSSGVLPPCTPFNYRKHESDRAGGDRC